MFISKAGSIRSSAHQARQNSWGGMPSAARSISEWGPYQKPCTSEPKTTTAGVKLFFEHSGRRDAPQTTPPDGALGRPAAFSPHAGARPAYRPPSFREEYRSSCCEYRPAQRNRQCAGNAWQPASLGNYRSAEPSSASHSANHDRPEDDMCRLTDHNREVRSASLWRETPGIPPDAESLSRYQTLVLAVHLFHTTCSPAAGTDDAPRRSRAVTPGLCRPRCWP